MHTITVTNLNDSGTGSLREAIALANAYTGTDDVQIVFDESLAGHSMFLSSALPAIAKVCTVQGNGVTLSNYGFIISCAVSFENITYPQITLVSPDESEEPYSYRIVENATISPGQTVELDDGVELVLAGGNLTVCGKLIVNNEVLSEAFNCSSQYCKIIIEDQGEISLTNADATIVCYKNVLEVRNGGRLNITNGFIAITDGINIDNGGEVVLNGVELDFGVQTSGQLKADNCTFNKYILVDGPINVTGQGNVFTSKEVFRLANCSGDTSSLLNFVSSVSREDAYICLTGSLYSCNLANVSSKLGGGYKTSNEITVVQGCDVKLEEGVTVGLDRALIVEGTLEAKYSEQADAILGSMRSGIGSYIDRLSVRNGGRLLLENANVILQGGKNRLLVEDDSRLEMTGGSLSVTHIEISSNGSSELIDVDIRASINNRGTLTLTDSSISDYIITSGTFEMQGVESTSYVNNTGALTAKDVRLGSYLDSRGTATLENVSCTTLIVDSVGDVMTMGEGVTMTGDEVFRLYNFSGKVDELLDSFTWTATSESDKYIGLSGEFGNATLTALPASLAAGYRMSGHMSVISGATMVLEDGVNIEAVSSGGISLYGTLGAKNTEVTEVLTNLSVGVQNGGKLLLENSSVNLRYGSQVYEGGTMEMTGGSLQGSELNVANGATAALVGVEVKSQFRNAGTTSLKGTTHSSLLYSYGSLEMQGVEITDAVWNYGTLTAKDVTVASYLDSRGTATLENVSCATLIVDSVGDVTTTGEGVTMTGAEVFRLYNFSGKVDELLDSFTWTATSESDKYIGLSGEFGNATLTALPASFAAGYRMSGHMSVISGATMVLEDGVNIDYASSGCRIDVYGSLEAKNAEDTEVLTGVDRWNDLNVQNGGKLLLENSSVKLSGSSSYVRVYDDGTLKMTGGSLQAWGGLNVSEMGTASLIDVEVKSVIINSGTLEMLNVRSNSVVENTGTLTATSVMIDGYLSISNTATLEDVTCSSLFVYDLDDVTTRGKGVTLTGSEVFCLCDFSGNVDDFLRRITWSATSEADKFISLTGDFGNTTLTDVSKVLGGSIDYKLRDSVVATTGSTMVLEDGVNLDISSSILVVRGTLCAEYAETLEYQGIIGNSYSRLDVEDGGVLTLTNAFVNIYCEGYTSVHTSRFQVYDGGTLEMTGGSLQVRFGLSVSGKGTASLDGVEVKSILNNSGTLILSNSIVNETIYIQGGSTASITGCKVNGNLDLSLKASTTITGNDFSNATLNLIDLESTTNVIDLSGNYWGTTDIDAIVAKIQNYSEDRVLISSILMAPPAQGFCFDATMAGVHRLSQGTELLTLTFNRDVDAATVHAESIILTDEEGNLVTIREFEVRGKQVTLHVDALPTGGYQLNCTAQLKDVDGKSYTASEAFAEGITYHCLQMSQPRVLLFRSNSTVTDVFSYVDVFFDQTMDDSRISLDSVHLYAPDGQEVELKSMQKAGVAGNVFYRFYFDAVSAKGNYTFSIDKSVCNDWGMGMAADYRQEIYVASPDLTVGTEIDLSSTTLGRYTTITYTVSNIGDAMTPGTWTDAVYLCRTQQWNEDEAILLGRYNRTEALSENGSYTASVKGLLSNLEPGNYYVFVRTDESNRLSEAQENNNVSATGTKVSISVPEFTGEVVSGQLSSANETLYYSFTPTESGSYKLTVDDSTATVLVTEAFNGRTPLNKKTSANNSHFSVFSAEAGKTYYIAIKGGKDMSYAAQIQKSQFAVYDSTFFSLAAGHPSTLTLVGSELTEGMSVYVMDENGVRYDAERVVIADSCQATVTFNLPENMASGAKLSLYAENEAGTVSQLDKSMHIASAADLVELSFSRMYGELNSHRVGWVWKTDLIAGNKAGYDVSNAIILVTDTDEDFAMYYSYDDARVRDRSALLFLGGVDALTPKVMTAGELGRLGVYVKQYRSGTGAIQAWLLDSGSSEEITAAQWAYFESALRPTACSDADWAAWWSDMKPRIGDTIGDFASFIYGMRDAVSAAGQKVNVSSLADLTDIAMKHCPDYVPSPAVYGTLTDNSTGEVLSGVDIYLYKIDGDKSILIDSATTDDSGSYTLYGMKPGGTYELKVHDFWCNDAEVPTSGSGQFVCEQNEDICMNGVIQQIEMVEIPAYRNNFVNVEDNKGGLLTAWNENEVACISYEQNNIIWQHYLDTTLTENSKLIWSEADECFIRTWIEHTADDSTLFWQYIRLGESGLEQSAIQSRCFEEGCRNSYLLSSTNEGIAAVIQNNNEASLLPEVIKLTSPEQLEWQGLMSVTPLTSAESWTGGTPEKLNFSISPSCFKKLGVLWSLLNPTDENGSRDGGIEATVTWEDGAYGKVEITGSSEINFWNPAGKVSTKSSLEVSLSGTLNATCKDIADEETQSCTTICKGNTLDWSGAVTPSLKVTVERPHGLLKALKLAPCFRPFAEGIEALAKLVEKYTPLKIYFGYGFSTTLSGGFTYDDGKWKYDGDDFESLELYVKIGGAHNPYTVTYTGGLSFDVDFDLENWRFDVKDAEPFGKVNIKLPWKGATIEFNGTLMELLKQGVKMFVNDTAVGQAIWNAGEWLGEKVGDGAFYAIKWGKGKWLELKEWTKGTIDVTKTKAIEFYNDAKRLIGNEKAHFIKTATTITPDNKICLVGVGTTASAQTLHGQTLTLAELEKYDEMLSDCLDTVLVDGETGQAILIDQSALENYGYSPLALTSGDSIESASLVGSDITKRVIDAEVLLYDDQVRLSWICNINGKYQLFFATLENGAWCNPELILESENTLSSCKLSEIRNQLIVTVTETDSENQLYQDKQFVWGGDEWSPYQSAAVEQTSAESLLHNTAAPVNVVSSFKEIIQSIERKVADLIGCPLPEPETELPHNGIRSYDPNDFYGPAAYGAENWIAPREMQFQILCENIPEENIAHAAMVTIKHKLDDAYDYSTFRLGDMMIGGNYIEVTEEVQSYKARLDWTSTLGVLVDVNAFFDADTGEVVWEFVAIDPETGWIVSDPFKGLLAPNYNPPEGDGWVYYYVEPKETTLTGTTATSQAEIIFDYNEPILTPVLSYTFDADKPVGAVTAVAAAACTRYLRVDWSGTDTGSGVACYNVFVSVDGGDWELWQENINATSALYTVAVGEHRYAFFAQAIDHTGLAEELAEQMPAEAATTTTHSPCKLTVTSLEALRAGDELTLRIVFSEKALCADWAAALQVTTSTQTIELSTGSFRYDESTHTLTWDGSVAGVPDGAQTTVRLKDGLVTDAQGQAFGSVAPAYSAPIALAGVAGSTYAAPALVDYNADGLMDVLVGEVAENGKGRIRIYLNEGTAEVASFATYIYAASAEDTPLELEASGCQGAIVRLADITGDGKDEMVVGLADGTIRIFTAAEGGQWADAGELGCLVGGESATVDAGTRAALEFVDANGDGRSDMLVGTGDGNVLLYLNTAAAGAAVFDAGRFLHDASGRIKVGSRVSVATGDFDGDGLWDMLLGTADGTVLFYRNEGSTATPLFGAAEVIWADDAPLDMSSETNRVRIDTGDLNGDGIDDLVVGQSDGKVKLLYGREGSGLIGEVAVGSIPLPKAPQNVQLTVNGGRVQISWSAVEMDESSAISYEISYRIEGSDTPEVLVVNETAHTLELADAVYSVQVRALNHGKGGDWSPAQRVMVDTIAPAVPAGMQSVGGETAAALSWNAVADAVSYEFRYRQAGSQVWRTVSSSITNASLESLSPAAYEWQVRATDAAGNASAWSASGSFAVTGVVPDTEQHWASGILFDASGAVTGGYFDVNKTGAADNNLCWAAAAANILAWWQEQGLTTTLVPEAPQGAAAIYSTFTQNWENASGAEAYAFIWWLSGDSTSQTYANYVNDHYCGDSSTGAYYKQFYTAQTISRHTAQVSLSGVGAAALSGTWAGIYGASGMIALGIFRSISSGGQLNGGHSLTLWGFESDKESGEITEIYVTDSDDSATTLRTLAVDYDAQTGYYTISQADSNFKGYVLGTYTWLNAFSGEDIVVPKVTLSAPVVEKLAEGRIRVTLSWSASESATYVLTVDGKDYALGSATSHTLELSDGEHNYSVKATDAAGNVGTAGSSFAMDATAPEAVQGVLATTGTTGVSVSWAAVADAATYTLQYATKADFSDAKTVEGITAAAHTLTGLPGTGTLYVRVSAADAAGNESGWSAPAQTGLDITAPVVTLKTPEMEKVGEGRIEVTLSWSSSESAVYTLTVDGKDYALGSATSHTLELADGEHSYSVKATDAAGNAGAAAGSFAYDASAPDVVQGVLATTGKTGVSVTWTAMADAATYTLQYATKADFSDAQTVEGITAAAHTLTGLPGTGTLYVRVSAADAAGNESDWSAPAQTGLDITAPVVTLKTPEMEKVGEGRIRVTLSWSSSESAVYTLTVDGKDYALGSATSHTLELPDGEHSYSVKATDATGNVGTAGSSFAMDATAPDVVQGVQTATSAAGVMVSWQQVTGAASYTVQYATKADFSDAKTVEGITAAAHTLTGLPGTGTLYVRVSAADAAGNESGWSAPAQTGLDITAPVVTLKTPEMEKVGEGRIRVTLSWSCSESAVYTLTVDGVDYAMETAMTHTLELADGEHNYSVKATDGAGLTGTAEGSFAMDATAPDAVQGVLATTGKTGVSVTWTAVADAATYTLQYATKADFSDAQTVEGITAAAHTLTGLPGTGTLYVRVSAADAAGNESGWSAPAQTGLDITAPVVTLKTPEMEKVGEGRIRVTLSWSSSESAVYTLTVDGKDYALGSATSHTLELADGEHSYSVKATDAAGNVGTASSSFAMDATAPEAVQSVLATTGKTGVSVTWTAVADAASYKLQYATTADFSDAQTVEGITAAAHTLTGLSGTGTLYVRVSAADAAGNESGWSAPAQTGLDITAPDAVQGLVSLAHGTSARLNWAAANDASGISGYRLQYAVNGDFSKANTMQMNGLETIFYTLQSNTTYQWRVAAVDGVGNIGAWSEVASFRTGAAEPADDSVSESHEIEMSLPAGGESHSSSPVSGWVGFDDPTDFYSFTAKGAGTYAVHLDSAVQGTQVFLSVGTLDAEGNFAAAQKLVVAPGSASSALGGIVLEKGEQCFIRVDSYDKGLGRYNGEYTLSVEAEVPETDILTDNNTLEKATVLAESSSAAARLTGWVGAGDAVDYYRFQLQDAAELTLVLDELESSVKVKLMQEQRDGSLTQVMSRSVKASSGLDRTLSLTSGTYFVEISSYDNGAGRYNSTYALELEKEEDGEVKRYAIAGSGL